MASGQGFSQGPQRPYNGPAAPNFLTRRNNTSSPQLPQNPYKNEYPNQSPAYSQGRQNYSGSARGNDFPPQDQEYYGGRKGLPIQRIGDSLDLVKRSASADGMRGGYNQRRLAEPGQEYQNGPAGRGKVSPLNLERSDTAGSAGPHIRRKPVKNAILSPEQTAWDNPFPTFPGAKKKTSQSEEQEILRKMAALEMGGTSEELPKDKPRKDPLESFANTGPSQKRNLPQGESVELRQGLPRSGYNSPAGNKIPVDKNYSERGYERAPENENRVESGLSERSHNTSLTAHPSQAHRKLPAKTANNFDFGLNGSQNEIALQVTRQRNGSLGEIYNTYYQPEEGKRRSSFDVEMPNFDDDLNASHKKGNSFELHMQVPPLTKAGHYEIKPLNIQSDPYGPQLQSQINESRYAENGFSTQQDYDYSYDNGYLNESQPNQNYGPPINYDSYNEPHVPYNFDPRLPPNNYQPPPRSTSVLARQGFDHYQNVEREDFSNFSNGPYSNYAANFVPEDEQSMFTQAGSYSSLSGEQVNKKPVPIRNYGNISSDQQFPQETPEDDGSLSLEPAPVTAAELDYLRNMIKMNPDDQATQLQLARRLVDASETLVKSIPDQRARNKARERYIMDAHKLLKKLIAQQNPDAMFYLADCYGRGALGLETDFKEAFSLYQSAAKLGHAAAAYRTAVCCELGNEEGGGTRKDPLKATQWYKRAAMLGDTPAMYKMGIVLLKGLLGQPRNPREAIGWLKRAAERADAENPHALHELALLYEQPQGTETSVIRDEAYSFQLFQQAADLGYKFSQFRLGCAYEYGLFNCPIDPRLSILWYSRAAAQGEHQSELALSGWYLTGSEGVLQQSDTEAYLWARKAAMAGLAKAEYAMGYFTEVGIGSPAKLEDAKRWYWRAASQNFPKARERLEDLKRGGNKAALRPREKISRSKKNPKEGLY